MNASSHFSADYQQPNRFHRWRDYLPLFILLGVAALAAWAKNDAYGTERALHGMHDFMGYFLVVFALLKLFDLPGFADGFQMYDLLAKPVRPYALLYPFIELALGLGYLAEWRPALLYAATVAIMAFGALGVIRALARGLNINCACMGNILKVPLSSVALTEDSLGMAAMAAVMWVRAGLKAGRLLPRSRIVLRALRRAPASSCKAPVRGKVINAFAGRPHGDDAAR